LHYQLGHVTIAASLSEHLLAANRGEPDFWGDWLSHNPMRTIRADLESLAKILVG
jgi:hypothetical protein